MKKVYHITLAFCRTGESALILQQFFRVRHIYLIYNIYQVLHDVYIKVCMCEMDGLASGCLIRVCKSCPGIASDVVRYVHQILSMNRIKSCTESSSNAAGEAHSFRCRPAIAMPVKVCGWAGRLCVRAVCYIAGVKQHDYGKN